MQNRKVKIFQLLVLTSITVNAGTACTGNKYTSGDAPQVDGASRAFSYPVQVTAGNESNFSPSLSVNGVYVLFTSDRNGNKDIWEKRSRGGYGRLLTRHKADDFSPVISPDGEKVAFVSRRLDAAGDIHIFDLGFSLSRAMGTSDGSIDAIESKLTEDLNPAWYPDNSKIVFSARRPGEKEPALMVANLEDRKPVSLADLRGDHPAVSPDGKTIAFTRGGAIYVFQEGHDKETQLTRGGGIRDGMPSFSQDGRLLAFIRYADDTNNDGQLNADDRPTIWSLDWRAQIKHSLLENYHLRPLTAASYAAYSPQIRNDQLYLTLQNQGSLDIFHLPATGHLDAIQDHEQFLRLVDSTSNFDEQIYLYRLAEHEFFRLGEMSAAGEVALAHLRHLVFSGRHVEATWAADKAQRNLENPEIKALLQLALLQLGIPPLADNKHGTKDLAARSRDVIEGKITEILQSFDQWAEREKRTNTNFTTSQRVHGNALLMQARILAATGEWFAAKEKLRKLRQDFGDIHALVAEASLFSAEVTTALGDRASAEAEIRSLIATGSASRAFLMRAAALAVRSASPPPPPKTAATTPADPIAESTGDRTGNGLDSENGGAIQTKVRNIRFGDLVGLRSRSAGLPILPAMAHEKISEIYLTHGEDFVASNELRDICELYPNSPEIVLRAAERLSRIEEKRGRHHAVEKMFDRLQQTLTHAGAKFQSHGRKLYTDFLSRRGHSLLSSGQRDAAIKMFKRLLSIDSKNLSGHRGLLLSHAQMPSFAELEDRYQQQAEDHPEDAHAQYSWGFSQVVKIRGTSPLRERLSEIDSAIAILEGARELDGSIRQTHQTLGWLYFQKGYWLSDYHDNASTLAVIDEKWGMVKSFLGFGDPIWIELSVDSFLQAYYLTEPDSLGRASIAQSLGQAYYELEIYKKSLDYFIERIRLLDIVPMNDVKAEAMLWQRAGRSAFMVEDLDLAKVLQQRALSRWEESGDAEQTAQAVDALALTQKEGGDYSAAMKLYSRLSSTHEQDKNPANLLVALTNLGICAYLDEQYHPSLVHLRQARELAQHIDSDSSLEGGGIQVGLGGSLAAKGFNLVQRRSLIESYIAKNYLALGRLNVARQSVVRRRDMLVAERALAIDEDDAPESIYLEEIAKINNHLGRLETTLGHPQRAIAAFLSSQSSARGLRSDNKSRYLSLDEATNFIAAKKLQLSLAAARLVPPEEIERARDELAKEAENLREVVASGSRAFAKPRAEILALSSHFDKLLQRPASADRLREAMDLRLEAGLAEKTPRTDLLAMADIDPQHLSDELPPSVQGLLRGFRQSALAQKSTEWKYLWAAGYPVDAFRSLQESLAETGVLSATDRFAAIYLAEKMILLSDRQNVTPDQKWQRWAHFRHLITNEIVRRGFPAKHPIHQGDLVGIPNHGASLIPNEVGALFAHLRADRSIHLLARFDGQSFEEVIASGIRTIDRGSVTHLMQKLRQSPLIKRLAALPTVFVIPSGGLEEIPWTSHMTPLATTDQQSISLIPSAYWIPAALAPTQIAKRTVSVVGRYDDLASSPHSKKDGEEGPPYRPMPTAQHLMFFDTDANGSTNALAKSLTENDMAHIAVPLQLNGVNVKDSRLYRSAERLPEREHDFINLYDLATLALNRNALFVFSDARYQQTRYQAGGQGHDDWILLTAALFHSGAKTLILADRNRNHERLLSLWTPFYENIETQNFSQALRSAKIDAQLVGFAGTTQAEDAEDAEDAMEEAGERAEDSFDKKQYREAARAYSDQLYFATLAEDKDEQESAWLGLVNSFYLEKNYAMALYYKKKLVADLKHQEDDQGYALGVVDLGVLAVRAHRFDEAERHLREAQDLFTAEADDAQLGKIWHYRALNRQNQRDYPGTITAYQQARKHLLEEDAVQAAQKLLDIANVYHRYLGDSTSALTFYAQAEEEFEEEEEDVSLAKVQIDRANALIRTGQMMKAIALLRKETIPALDADDEPVLWIRANQLLVNAYFQFGRLRDARNLNATLLQAIKELDDEANRARWEVDALAVGGLISARLDGYKAAQQVYTHALALTEKFNLLGDRATILNNFGFIARSFRDVDRSIRLFEEALRIDRELKDEVAQAFDLRNLGISVSIKGDLARAESLLSEALTMSQNLNLSRNEIYCQFGLAEIALKQTRWQEAENRLTAAQQLASASALMPFIWRAEVGLAEAARNQGKLDQANKLLVAAIEKIESANAGLETRESPGGASLTELAALAAYHRLIDTLMDSGQVIDALKYAERAKLRRIIDTLGVDDLAFASPEIHSLWSQYGEAQAAKNLFVARGARSDENLAALSRRLADLRGQLEKSDPAALRFLEVKPEAPTAVQARLRPDEGMVVYHVSPHRVHIWFLDQQEIIGKSVALDRDQLRLTIDAVRKLHMFESSPRYVYQELENWLLRPIAKKVATVQNLTICPDDRLHLLPFAGLASDQQHLSDKALRFLDAISYLAPAHSDGGERPIAGNLSVLAFGQPLSPFAEKAEIAAQRYISRWHTRDDKLPESNGKAEVLHLNGTWSGNRWIVRRATAQSLFYTPPTLMTQRLPRLVVMPSAREAILPNTNVAGRIAWRRGLAYAGARSVLAPLWRFNDVSAGMLIKRFYRHLAAGDPPARALMKAQRTVRHFFPHPAHWAGFRLVEGA